jgi:hypothetical protein
VRASGWYKRRSRRPFFTPDVLAHAAAPGAVADIIVYLVSDAAVPVSGAIVPAYGA